MPQVTIYIRDEDSDKWNAIADRPTWLHQALNPVPFTFAKMQELMEPIEELVDKPGSGIYSEKNINKMFDNVTYKKVKEVLDSGALDDPTYTDMEDTP